MLKQITLIAGMTLSMLSFSSERDTLQSALDAIYRADSYIVDGEYRDARLEIREARMLLMDIEGRDMREARLELSESLDNVGYDDEASRTHLNNAETLVEERLHNCDREISRAELRSALDHIYRADTDIVDNRYSRARGEENDAIDILEPYTSSDSEMEDAVRYLRRSLRLIGDDDSRARDELNRAETIIERRLGH